MPGKKNLKSLSPEELASFFREMGLPAFRARQLLHWIYGKNVTEIREITEFSKELREKLSSGAYISNLKLISSELAPDSTAKYLFGLEDGETIESVLIPDEDRLTLCISSQVGCAMGCGFCLTGEIGLKRNLHAFEISDQILAVNRFIAPRRITNVVFMGMGEPLLNLDEVGRAIGTIIKYIKLSGRRITVSTCGIAPRIPELAKVAPGVNLAVSLNAPDDETRSRIMPVNRRYPLKELLAVCRAFPLAPRRRITFEYVLIGGLNDSDVHAEKTVRILRGIRSKVNLIPFNPSPGSDFRRPDEQRILSFQKILLQAGITSLIRKSKGAEISAACGQLRAGYQERKGRPI